MQSIFATTRARIWGTTTAWSAGPFAGPDQPNQECTVKLEIVGDDSNGYNLVMAPSGFFTADTWHETKQEALETANEMFEIDHNSWSDIRPIYEE